MKRGFASDNNAGVHPKFLEAMARVNVGHVPAYGYDPFTQAAVNKFKEHLGESVEVFFVFGGTGANTLSIKSVTDSYNAVICADTAHIHEDECGAPEKFTGCKLITVSTDNGKLTPEKVMPHLKLLGSEHKVQPKVISITQTTEYGTVYSPHEIRALADLAHSHGLFLHMDGARISNAAVALDLPFAAFTRDVGVDILSFGGTKIGMVLGEAVVFFNKDLAKNFKYIRKHGMQLPSKSRFVAAQFEALFTEELWRSNATNANKMAKLLESKLRDIPHVKVTQTVGANGVFATMLPEHLKKLREKYFFHTWDEEKSEVRWMTSFDTTAEDVEEFVAAIREVGKQV